MQVPLGTVHDYSPILSTTIQRYVALQESGIYSHELRNATTRIWLMYIIALVSWLAVIIYMILPFTFLEAAKNKVTSIHASR
jgi:hypothetical protein